MSRDCDEYAFTRAVREGPDAPAAPDRPGDRDQQQAAERIVARIVARPWREQRDVIAAALAAARAEEAARWQAKIEALTRELDHWAKTRRGDKATAYSHTADMLRAVLDGGQR